MQSNEKESTGQLRGRSDRNEGLCEAADECECYSSVVGNTL